MKRLSTMMAVLACTALMACGSGGTSGDVSLDDSDELTTREQAEIVVAALTSEQGGLGEDLEIIVDVPREAVRLGPESEPGRDAHASLSVSASLTFYDGEGNLQEDYSPTTTDRIDYESSIEGEFTSDLLFFHDFDIDNGSSLIVDGLLTDIITIDGSHLNRSSYRRVNPLTLTEVTLDLDCTLLVTGLTVDLTEINAFPESGTIEGAVEVTYERDSLIGELTKRIRFDFVADYRDDNRVEVELSDGTLFTLHLDTDAVAFHD